MSVTTDQTKTGIVTGIQSYTWANLPAAASNTNIVAFASDLGASGTLVISNGTRWKPVNGTTMLKSLAAAVSGVANTETIVMQSLIPANAWQTNDTIRIWAVLNKSGTTDNLNFSVRIGTAGTTADTIVTGFSSFAPLTAAGTNGGAMFDIRLSGATSAQKLGASGNALTTYSTPSSASAAAAATTITDASANALYVSVGLASSGTTNTVGITGGQIQLVTP